MNLGDSIEFAFLWAWLPPDRRQAVTQKIQEGILDDLREAGIRVDGDDVAVFVGTFCVKRPLVVVRAMGLPDDGLGCRPVSEAITARAFRKWRAEHRRHCNVLVESAMTGLAVELLVDRLYLPGHIIVEYVKGIMPVRTAPRVFTFAPAHILGRAE